MKRLLWALLLSALLLVCRNRPEEGRILFLGDSITQDGRYVSLIEYELFKRGGDVELISIGLSSETVSGLTEEGHPYPRPCLHDRLPRALEKIRPQIVFACYGMNDGIYHPFDEERFEAFRQGVVKLIDVVRAAGAQLVLLTPPLFDVQPIAAKAVCIDAERFGYSSPFEDYNEVLAAYAAWMKKT